MSLQIFIHGNAGAFASLVSTLVLYPFENIKTRMQIIESDDDSNSGFRSIILKVLQEQGIKGFYKGITPLLTGNYISYGIYFFWYEYFKHPNATSIFSNLKPSFYSAVITTVATNPFWVVQSKMTLAKDNANFLKTTKKMLQEEGLHSLFKGLEASLILVINPIIQFLIYEALKEKFSNFPYQTLLHFFAGAFSKAIATFITYVIYTISNLIYSLIKYQEHMLMYYKIINQNVKIEKNADYLNIFKTIMRKGGIKGLYRGFSPKLTQTVLNSAFMLMLYEKIHVFFRVLLLVLLFQKKHTKQ